MASRTPVRSGSWTRTRLAQAGIGLGVAASVLAGLLMVVHQVLAIVRNPKPNRNSRDTIFPNMQFSTTPIRASCPLRQRTYNRHRTGSA